MEILTELCQDKVIDFVDKYSEQFNKQYRLYGFGVSLAKENNPVIALERIMDEMGTRFYSFEEFLKIAEEKKVDLVIAEKFFEQKMLEGTIILKPNKMYQNIP